MEFRVQNIFVAAVAMLGLASTLGCSKVAPNITGIDIEKSASTEPPSIFVSNPPTQNSKVTVFDFAFTGANIGGYRVKCGPAASTDCGDKTGYSDWKALSATWHMDMSDATAYPDGEMRLCVYARDAEGEEGEQINPTHVDWVKDTVAPAPTFTAVTATSVPGTVSASVGAVSADDIVTVYQDANCSGAPSAATTATTATAVLSVALLTDGNYSLYANAKDKAGNVSSCVGPVAYAYDTTPPVIQAIQGVYSGTTGANDVIPDDVLGDPTGAMASLHLSSDVAKIELGVYLQNDPAVGSELCTSTVVYNSAPNNETVDLGCDGHSTWVQGEQYRLIVTASDAAGNRSAVSKDFTYDISNPGTATITGVSGGSDSVVNSFYTNSASSGVHTVKVTYTEPSGAFTESIAITDSNGTCTSAEYSAGAAGTNRTVDVANCPAMSEGPASLQLTIKGKNGHSSSTNFPFVVDRTPPAPATGLGVTGGVDTTADLILAANHAPTFTFTSAADAVFLQVSVLNASQAPVCTAATSPSPATLAGCALANGSYFAKVDSTDAAGLTSTVNLPFTVAIPGTVSIDGITGLAGTRPADSAADSYLTSDGQIQIHWTYGGGATGSVSLGIDGVMASFDATGWSPGARIDDTSVNGSFLTQGSHVATISYTDSSGPRLLSMSFIVDTQPPVATVGSLSRGDVNKDGFVQFDVQFMGADSYAIAANPAGFLTLNTVPGVTCDPLETTVQADHSVRVKIANCQGNGTGLTVSLAAGAARDDAGNFTDAVTSAAFNVDNVAPTVAVSWDESPTRFDPVARWTPSGSDIVSLDFEFYSQAVGGGTSTVYAQSIAAGSKTMTGLADGTYSCAARVKDAAGNEYLTPFVDVKVDRVAPLAATGLTLTSAAATNTPIASFSWTKSSSLDLFNQKLRVYGDSACTTQISESAAFAPAVETGSVGFAVPGDYYVSLISSDQAGNSSRSSACLKVTYDTTPPAISNLTWTASRTKTSPILNWTASTDVQKNQVTLYSDSSCTVAALTFAESVSAVASRTLTGVAEGTFYAKTTVKDAAGNAATSDCSSAPVTVDRTAPAPTGFHLTSASPTTNPVVSVAWTKSPDADLANQTLMIYSDGSCSTYYGSSGVGTTPSADSVSMSALSYGVHSLLLQSLDDLGNWNQSNCVQVTYTQLLEPPASLGWDQTSPTSILTVQAQWTPPLGSAGVLSQNIDFFGAADCAGSVISSTTGLSAGAGTAAYAGTLGMTVSYRVTEIYSSGTAAACSSPLTFSSATTLVLSPQSDADDGMSYKSTFVYLHDANGSAATSMGQMYNSGATRAYSYIRFRIPTGGIPAGAQITGANLKLLGAGSSGWTGSDALRIQAEATGNAPQVTSDYVYPANASGVGLTLASVRWPASGGLSWNVSGVNTIDVSPVIQSLVDRYGSLTGGSFIQLWIGIDKLSGSSTRTVSYLGYGATTTDRPALELTYSMSTQFGTGADGAANVTSAKVTTAVTVASGGTSKRLSALRRIKNFSVSGSNLILTLDSSYSDGTTAVGDFAMNDEVMWHVTSSGADSGCRIETGRYGFSKVVATTDGSTSITITRGTFPSLTASELGYTSSNNSFCFVQLIRVPQLSALTVSSTLTVPGYNSTTGVGGIFVARVNGTMSLSGNITAAGAGYPGGAVGANGAGQAAGGPAGLGIGLTTGGTSSHGGGNASVGGDPGDRNDPYSGVTSQRAACFGAEDGVTCLPGTRAFFGGGGGGGTFESGGAGANGGGIILLFVNHATGSGTLNAAGDTAGSFGSTPGGGGAGGTIRIVSLNLGSSLVYRVNGGDGGSTYSTSGAGGGGGGAGFLSRVAPSIPTMTEFSAYYYPGSGGNSPGLSGLSGGPYVPELSIWDKIMSSLF